MRRLQIVLLALCTLLPATASTAQEPARLALLIGNKDYTGKIQPLKAPHNDIMTVGNALAAVRFKVTALPNASRRQMLSAVKNFAAELAKEGPDAVGFLYYSGHGVARPEDRANYLIPIDLTDTSSTDFWFDAVKLDDILSELERAAPFAAHFVVFDACRDELKLPYKSAAKGFEPVAERSGMFIAFATALGAVALDEVQQGGGSGPYSSALAAELTKPGQDHLQLFQNVKEGVFAATSRQQVPWERNGLLRRIYFGGTPNTAKQVETPAVRQLSEAAEAWGATKDASNVAVLEAFAAQYKDTFYAELARARIQELRTKVAAPLSPAVGALPKASSGPFDGHWSVEAFSNNACRTKTWQTTILIDGTIIATAAKKPGRLAPNGIFEFYHPASFDSNFLGTFVGKLEGNSGKGTFKYGSACRGTITLKRE